MKIISNAWEKVFKKQGKFFYEPHIDMPGVIQQLKKNKAKTVLDLGCWTGRHTVQLAKEGFSVYGLDNSTQGIQTSKERLKEEKLSAHFVLQEMTENFPWKNDFFDAIICIQVIHHGDIATIKKIIAEIERVLKKWGFIFITVPNHKHPATKFKEIEPNTYIHLDGIEKGMPHHYFTPEELKEFFAHFDIIDIHLDNVDHLCLSAFKK